MAIAFAVVTITSNAVLSPVHLSVCGKSQEHSTPAFMIFGHSHTVSEEDDGDGDGDSDNGGDNDGNAWDRFFGMPSSCVVTIADGDNVFSLVIVVLMDVSMYVDVVINVEIFIVVVVTLFSVASKHDADIINVKMSTFRNNFDILKRDVWTYLLSSIIQKIFLYHTI